MIIGQFRIEVPCKLSAREKIKAVVDYKASYPGALYWSTCIMVKLGRPPYEIIKIVTSTRELGDEGGGEHTYTIANMPNGDGYLEFRLFGHNDAGHHWIVEDWYTEGRVGQAVKLDSELRVIKLKEEVEVNGWMLWASLAMLAAIVVAMAVGRARVT